MNIAILTLDAFNELDSFISYGILNRMKSKGWKAYITSPTPTVTLGDRPACTDVTTKPWVMEAGVRVLDQPFYAEGNIATAGGCLAQQYLAAWVLLRAGSREDA